TPDADDGPHAAPAIGPSPAELRAATRYLAAVHALLDWAPPAALPPLRRLHRLALRSTASRRQWVCGSGVERRAWRRAGPVLLLPLHKVVKDDGSQRSGSGH